MGAADIKFIIRVKNCDPVKVNISVPVTSLKCEIIFITFESTFDRSGDVPGSFGYFIQDGKFPIISLNDFI